MQIGRLLAGLTASGAVAACALLALGMSQAATAPTSADAPLASAVASSIPATLPSPTSQPASATRSATPTASRAGTTARRSAPRPSARSAPKARPAATHSRPPRAVTHAPTTPAQRPAPVRGGALPLPYSTGAATRVITVTAPSAASTTATLQAWNRAPGGGWLRTGPAITAHVGSAGLTTAPSEFRSATPIGSFTLTQAFGAYANPGTPLPYFQTNGADWWISQSGPLYNTHQHCWSNCPFTQGDPNEHLYYEQPYYDYAVVINTPSGASAYPHGSAFFLHVTDGAPTAGCVAIPAGNLVTIMRWLAPWTHPRILIGVT